MTEAELREAVVTGARILDHEGHVASVGHLSARLDAEHFLITPRKGPGTAGVDELLVLDLEGRVTSGDGEANSERFIHSEIYRARPDVGAIAHTHSTSAIVLGITGVPVRVVHNWGTSFYDGVPVYEDLGYVRFASQGRDLAEVLADHRACLMRGHGAVVVGADVIETTIRSLELEYNCMLQLAAMQAGGGGWSYPAGAAAELDGKGNPRRLWDYYKRRAGIL